MILLDFDSEKEVDHFITGRARLEGFVGIEREEWWLSKSGYPHQHAILHIKKELPDAIRIGMAVCAGSDPIRGMLALYRITLGNDDPDRLFRPEGINIKTSPIFAGDLTL